MRPGLRIATIAAGLWCLLAGSLAAGPLADALKRQGATCPHRDVGWVSALSFSVFEDDGVRILVASGVIHAGDADRLAAAIARAGRVDEIWWDSPGGDAAEGPKLGRVTRHAHLATRVPAGFQCISSCTLAFLGGIVRNVDPGGAYGVHTFFNEESFVTVYKILTDKTQNFDERIRRLRIFMHENEQGDAILAAEWQRYMQEMGISRNFLLDEVLPQRSIVLTTDSEIVEMRSEGVSDQDIAKSLQSYHCPDGRTLRKYNVINVE
jgi:hypothetical protein